MSIQFHCQSCKKKIKAPDEAGGKWGACPFCKHRNYIPTPPDPNAEELRLMPLDESDETQYGSLMKETYDVTKVILHETAMPEGDDAAAPDMSEKEILKQIILYLRYIAHGQLEEGQEIARRLSGCAEKARDILVRMQRTQRPEPELADIPPKLLLGFIKNLHSQLG